MLNNLNHDKKSSEDAQKAIKWEEQNDVTNIYVPKRDVVSKLYSAKLFLWIQRTTLPVINIS